MKVQFILRFLVVVALASSVVISGVIENTHRKRRKHLPSDGGDYEASGDYFEIEGQVRTTEKLSTLIAATMSTMLMVDAGSGEGSGSEFETSTLSSSSLSSTEGSDIDDDGSTCISTNITRFDDVYELRNHVLAIFKVNVSSNGRELYYFLNLAKRFSLSEIEKDVKFVVICADMVSEDVREYIMSSEEDLPGADMIAVFDETDEVLERLGLPDRVKYLHVYIVDQCSKIAFVIAPPWSSAKYPYVKAGVLSCFFDLPCGCPASEFISYIEKASASKEEKNMEKAKDVESHRTNNDDDEEDVENIEELLNNSNFLSGNQSTFAMEGLIPLRIVIPSLHVHYDNQTSSYWLYEDLVIKSSTETTPYNHFHSQKSGTRLLEVRRTTSHAHTTAKPNRTESEMFVGNRTIKDIWTIAQSNQIFIDRYGRAYKIQKTIPSGFDVVQIDYDVERTSFTQQYGTREHYEQLKKWTDVVI